MQKSHYLTTDINSGDKPFLMGSGPQSTIFIAIFVISLIIRLYHITEAPSDFQPVRQYQAAHIARADYYETLDSVSESKKELAKLNSQRMGFLLEPRIMEYLAVIGYRMTGGEHLWIPKTVSSIFWMIGGIFLYLLARKLSSERAAKFCTIYYLFLPFGISASRSFQPDPMMIMFLIGSFYLIYSYFENPAMKALILAAVMASLAILIKPYSLFVIFGAFISIKIYKDGFQKSLFSKELIMFTSISMMPGVFYYGYGLVMNSGYLRQHTGGSILPHLLLYSVYWKNWFSMILRVIGLASLIGAMAGLFLVDRGVKKFFLAGLWIGYLLFGMTFTFHIHTHDYYQLLFIPVVALSLCPVAEKLLDYFLHNNRRAVVLTVCLLVVISGIAFNIKRAQKGDYHNGYRKVFNYMLGINPQFYKFIKEDYRKDISDVQEIGRIVNHSTNTVFLTSDWGRFLTYYGELSGLPWYTTLTLKEMREKKVNKLPWDEIINKEYFIIRVRTEYYKYFPDFFIITDFKEFDMQPELREFLFNNYRVTARTNKYLIFDLHSETPGAGQKLSG